MARKIYVCSTRKQSGYWLVRYIFAGDPRAKGKTLADGFGTEFRKIPMRNARYIAKVQAKFGGFYAGLLPFDDYYGYGTSLSGAENMSVPTVRRLANLAKGGNIDA